MLFLISADKLHQASSQEQFHYSTDNTESDDLSKRGHSTSKKRAIARGMDCQGNKC